MTIYIKMIKKPEKFCKLCNKPIKTNRTYCSYTCSSNDPEKQKKAREKAKQTNIKKYGYVSPLQNKDILEKRKITNLKRYGVENVSQIEEIKNKKKKTTLKNHGVDNPSKSYAIQNKKKNTFIRNYGKEHPLQSEEIKDKIKKTNIEKYGVENVFQSEEIKDKIKKTNIEKYGVTYANQRHNIRSFSNLDNYKWLYEEYVIKEKTATEISLNLNVEVRTICNYLRKHNIIIKRIKASSWKSIQWLRYISNKEKIFIQHGGNIGEYQIPNTNFCADGYCEETNTIYEFHGDLWHGNPQLFESDEYCHPFDPDITAGELYQKTINRENTIKELGYNLVVIWENAWNEEYKTLHSI